MTWTKRQVAVLTSALVSVSGTAIVAVRAAVAHAETLQADETFAFYAQVFAQGLRGQAGAQAIVQVMREHPPAALNRLSLGQRPSQTGAPSGMRVPQGACTWPRR
jgi:hypothetical protein